LDLKKNQPGYYEDSFNFGTSRIPKILDFLLGMAKPHTSGVLTDMEITPGRPRTLLGF